MFSDSAPDLTVPPAPLTREEHFTMYKSALEYLMRRPPEEDEGEDAIEEYLAAYKQLAYKDFFRLWGEVAGLQAALPEVDDLELVRDLVQKREDLELNKHAVPRLNRMIEASRRVRWP